MPLIDTQTRENEDRGHKEPVPHILHKRETLSSAATILPAGILIILEDKGMLLTQCLHEGNDAVLRQRSHTLV